MSLSVRALTVLAAALLLALLTYGVLAQPVDTTIDDALARSQAVAAPGFELEVLAPARGKGPASRAFTSAAADGRVALEELRGRPVVVNFWASWCEPCREEAPLLQAAWQDARQRGVLFVGLDMQDARGDARAFLREFSITYPNVRDPGEKVARRWRLTGLPETFFINAKGEVVAHVIGAIDRRQLANGITAAESGRPLSTGRAATVAPHVSTGRAVRPGQPWSPPTALGAAADPPPHVESRKAETSKRRPVASTWRQTAGHRRVASRVSVGRKR